MKKKVRWACVGLMGLAGCTALLGTKYQVITTLGEVLPMVEEAKKEGEVIVFFDIDYTLTRPDSPLLTLKNMAAHKDILRDVKRGLSAQHDELLGVATVVSFPQVLIDQDAPDVIRKIQDQGIACYGCTALITGAFDDIPSLEDWRLQELVKLGIVFSQAPEQNTTFPSQKGVLGRIPLFKDGTFFVCGENRGLNKAEVMNEFFKRRVSSPQGKLPAVVIMVDDKERNLRYAQNRLQHLRPKIHFIGVKYRGGMREEDPVSDPAAFRELAQRLIVKVLKVCPS